MHLIIKPKFTVLKLAMLISQLTNGKSYKNLTAASGETMLHFSSGLASTHEKKKKISKYAIIISTLSLRNYYSRDVMNAGVGEGGGGVVEVMGWRAQRFESK